MAVLIAALFIATATPIIVGTFVEGVIRMIWHLFPWDEVPEWIRTLSDVLER